MTTPVPVEYLTSFAQSTQALMQQLTAALLMNGQEGPQFARFTEVAAAQQEYLTQMGAVWMDAMMRPPSDEAGKRAGKGDRRFAGEAWEKSPYHAVLRKIYLVNARYVNRLIEHAAADEKTRGRLRFFARQILDALSPAN